MLQGPALIRDIDACQLALGQAAFWWLGQHGFAVKLGNAVCYIDAFLSPMEGRQVPPLLNPADITNATLVLGSHDHGDHIDRPAWPLIAQASPRARFVVPKLLQAQVARELKIPQDRVLGVDEGITLTIAQVQVTAVPAAHEFLDTDPTTDLHPYLGFMLVGNGLTLYHAGDTCLYEGMQATLRRFPLDLAFLPINGRDAQRLRTNCIGNMTYQEAVDLAGALRPGLVIPTHFEMFAMNSADPRLFVDYLNVKYPERKTLIPEHGCRTLVDRNA
ncbi:MAG: MBL fold metallo-hydrolase [Phycisphaerae bacterium]